MAFDPDLMKFVEIGLTAVGSAAAGAAVAGWRLSAQISKIETKSENNDRRIDEIIARHEKADVEADGEAEKQAQRWTDLNLVLGQIQGELKGRRR